MQSQYGCTYHKESNVITIRVYIPQESTQRKKANRLKTNVYFVKKNIEFTSVKGTKP